MTQGESQVHLEQSERLTQSKVEGSKLLSIQQFAQVCRTTPRTLRFYEQKELFKPAKIDMNNKYRFYDPKQARDFLKIRLLQNFHITLAEIRDSLSKNSAEEFIDKKLKGLREEIKEREKEYKFLEKIKSFLFDYNLSNRHSGKRETSASRISLNRDSGVVAALLPKMTNMWNIFQVKTFGPFNLFCTKVEHGEYAKITDYIKTLWKEAKRLKLKCEPSEITFYLNNAYNPKNTPLEIALTPMNKNTQKPLSVIASEAKQSLEIATVASGDLAMTNKNFYFKSYPKTKVLAYEYHGPYEYLILVYQKLFSYIESQKITLKDLVFETYKYGPLNTKSKYDYQTIIGFPI